MKNLKKDFPWFDKNKDLTYLDSGATSLKPQCVIDAVNKYLNQETYNSHNTDSSHTFIVSEMIKESKINLANFLGTESKNLIFTPGATYSLNMIANGIKHILKENDEILLNTLEHASNLLPWFEIAEERKSIIKYIDSKEMFLTEKEILNSISSKTKIISFANGTNLIGAYVNAEEISFKIKDINPDIIICIDGTQYVPMNKMKLLDSKIDFLACSGHKMCAPTGIGLLYFSNNIKSIFKPSIFGGGMNKSIEKNGFKSMDNNNKFEAGTLNFIGIYGWNAAIKYLNSLNLENIKKNIIEIKKYMEDKISKIPNFKVINKGIDSYILIFKHDNVFGQDMANYLGRNNIIVRSGLSCAKLIHYNINDSDVVRASLYIYSNLDDANKLIDALKKYKKGDELDGIL